jgi:hypothetical protein
MFPCFELCGAQGWVCWEEDNDSISGPWDHDVVECFTVLHLPVIPRRAFHTYSWSSNPHLTLIGPHPVLETDSSFALHPIRLSGSLIAKSFLRRWLYPLTGAGLMALLQGLRLSDPLWRAWLLLLGLGAVLFSLASVIWLRVTESRIRRIRRLLGRHRHGSSDPAIWTDEDRGAIPESQEMFGCRLLRRSG